MTKNKQAIETYLGTLTESERRRLGSAIETLAKWLLERKLAERRAEK